MFLDQMKPPSLSDHQTPAWHALYTRHQHEKAVAEVLRNKGFEVLLPLYSARHRWKDRNKIVSLPLFPCYVFLYGGLDRRLGILKTPGLHSFVSFAGQPATIPVSEIQHLRQAVESGGRLEPHPYLKCGDWVRVKRGPLEGVEGFLVRWKNFYRLVLSVEMLGKAASVELDPSEVERICKGRTKTFAIDRSPAHGSAFLNAESPFECGN
jgi:transcription antitermination factor NusG